ncbi:hypothetical protein M9978_01130 [Sphingomonas sp. MG17]|uniref:Uncharacterized protein n=1 Tax=Sphingomonas tagetis TaxID=2949092 RepID=A0A9X2HGC2_9SPHN|nr:hypothetical protein [Sphingomonas tagetis]MCP3729022.1 hypothetical protein [Sphingomonas tagetis]
MRRFLTLAALTSLTACTVSDEGYPSLLPRPIESRSDAEPVRPDPVATPDAALDRRIAEQRALSDAAARRFQSAALEAETRVAVARGLAIGSEPWVRAQTALADLAPIRGETTQIVSSLEETAIARASAGEAPYPALDAAIAELGAIAQAQGDRVAALESALGG